MTVKNNHARFMRAALGLAKRGLGNVWPNPAVGCIIVDTDGHVCGRGWTQPSGRPHAETEALKQAGTRAKGATAYVTLEPCSHTGETGPCARALIHAGVKRVVCALGDPDPRVVGRGLSMLRDAGIEVLSDVLEAEARALNAGFLSRIERERPYFTVKLATTLDARMATHTGDSQWITGPQARRYGHMLRAQNDAILTAIGTVNADDPSLDCRLAGLENQSPVRIVIDAQAEISAACKLVRTAKQRPLWLVTGANVPAARLQTLSDLGVHVVTCALTAENRIDLADMAKLLASKGFTRVLVEGGSGLTTAMLSAGLADELAWFRAPSVIGGDGLPAIGDLGVETLAQIQKFHRTETIALEADVLERYVRSDG